MKAQRGDKLISLGPQAWWYLCDSDTSGQVQGPVSTGKPQKTRKTIGTVLLHCLPLLLQCCNVLTCSLVLTYLTHPLKKQAYVAKVTECGPSESK